MSESETPTLDAVSAECLSFFDSLSKKYPDLEFVVGLGADKKVNSFAKAGSFGAIFWLTEIIREQAKRQALPVEASAGKARKGTSFLDILRAGGSEVV